ncbi:MAG: glutamate--tRNA ligase [Acidobacteria bacterium]|nr:glutamate--tRNA ligase [Acidobacteriota bacterium]
MSEIRVRIAPSPTGTPHVGTAYIALFNYCFAKSQGGKFLLRIEDTDQTRSDRLFEDMILQALRWTGLTWDEGPDVGGPYGPYRQSERTEIYREHAQILLEKGHAYKCFCTPEQLEEARQAQFKAGFSTGYDGRCSHLTPETIAQHERENAPFTIRMKVPESGKCEIHDPLRGLIEIDYKTVDHQILLKSDGFPTYHLANVVDDHLMKISHVIRGEEWLPSLPKHLLLYTYFGWNAPVVYHMPLLRNADQSKLSKRKNPTSILYYRDLGILPEALINFLGLMAYTLPEGDEIFFLEQMVKSFDIQRISLGGPIFDLQKLTWVNQKHIANLQPADLLGRLMAWKFNPDFMGKMIPLMQNRMPKLGDFMSFCDFMFYSEVSYDPSQLIPKKQESDSTRDLLYKVLWEMEKVPFPTRDDIEALCKKVGTLHGWSLRDVTHALRIAICGKSVAPPQFDVMEILGGDLCRNRILQAINALNPLGKKKLESLQEAYWQAASSYQVEEAT